MQEIRDLVKSLWKEMYLGNCEMGSQQNTCNYDEDSAYYYGICTGEEVNQMRFTEKK